MTVKVVAQSVQTSIVKMLNGNMSYNTKVRVGDLETDGASVELRTHGGRVIGFITMDGSEDLGWVLELNVVNSLAKGERLASDFILDVWDLVRREQWLLDSDLCERMSCDRELLDGLALSLHCDRDETRWLVLADWCEENDKGLLATHLRHTHKMVEKSEA